MKTIQHIILKKTIISGCLAVFFITGMFFIQGFAKKVTTTNKATDPLIPLLNQNNVGAYDSEIIEGIEKFQYLWFSGMTKDYTEEKANFMNLIAKYKKNRQDPKNIQAKDNYELANLFFGLFFYTYDEKAAGALLKDKKDLHYQRLHLLYAMHNPEYKGFDINKLLAFSNQFKDYDWLWLGNYYLQRGQYADAKNYYISGIQKTKKLLQAFDIMLEAVSIYKSYNQYQRKVKNFLSVLPFVRPEDAFFFMKDELGLRDYTVSVYKASDFTPESVKTNLLRNVFPIYNTKRLIYLTHGDTFLLLKSYLVFKDDEMKLIKNEKSLDYLDDIYQDIASFLLKKRLISMYLDGRVHIISPAQGPFVTTLFYDFKKIAGPFLLDYNKAIKIFTDSFAVTDVKPELRSYAAFDIGKIEKNINDDKLFPVFIKNRYPFNNPVIRLGDIYLLLHTYLVFKQKKDLINMEQDLSKTYKNIPKKYQPIVHFLMQNKVITEDSKDIDTDKSVNPIEFMIILNTFKQKVKL